MRGVEVLVDQRGQVKRHSLLHRQVPRVVSVENIHDKWVVLIINHAIEKDSKDAQVIVSIGMNDVELCVIEFSIDCVF